MLKAVIDLSGFVASEDSKFFYVFELRCDWFESFEFPVPLESLSIIALNRLDFSNIFSLAFSVLLFELIYLNCWSCEASYEAFLIPRDTAFFSKRNRSEVLNFREY